MKYLLALLLLLARAGQAEPFYPLLSQAQTDSLRQQVWQGPHDTNRVLVLLRLSNDLIAKGKVVATAADSAYAYAHQAQRLSEALHFTAGQLASSYTLGWLWSSLDKKALGQQTIRAALRRSRQLHLLPQEALGWYYLGLTLDSSPANLSTRISYFTQAARCYERAADQAGQAYCLKEVADMHYGQGNFKRAREELLRAEALYRASDYRRLHYTFHLLGMMNTLLGNYHDGLRYGLAAIRSAKSTQDTAQLGHFYMRVGLTYYELNELAKVDEYLRLALQEAIKYHNEARARFLAVQIGRNMVVMGRPKQALAFMKQVQKQFPPQSTADSVYLATGFLRCYIATKHYKLAAECCQLLSRQVEELPASYVNRIEVYLGIGRFYVATQQYNQARSYLQKTIVLSKNAGYKTILESSYLLLFKADSAQGQAMAAIADYQQYKTMHDSIFNEKNSKQLAGLQIQYDTKEKEQSIALLTKQSLLQQMTIRQREFQRNVFLGGTVLLVGLLGLGYNRYRLKQRSARLLEQKQLALQAQQAEIHRKNEALERVLGEKDHLLEERQQLLVEKDWMLKEIHHRVKNNLQVVSSLLATQSRHLLDPQAVAAIRESQNRVQVMALLHQKLYQADNLGRVNMADYAREIVLFLVQSFDRTNSVQVKLDLTPIELDTTLATPLGLIINEAVTNALKHAFPPPRRGTLTVRLASLATQHYELTITDDGVGLPAEFDVTRSRSLGMVILKGLSRQLDGQLAVRTDEGVRLSLQFDTRKQPTPAEVVA